VDFLDYLVTFMDCDYLSDLRSITITPKQAADLRALPDGQFTMPEYQEAVNYILGHSIPCSSPAAARALIADFLSTEKTGQPL